MASDSGTGERRVEGKRILIVSVGTRGDVQPYINLANALIKAGHHTAIATHFPFEEFVGKNSPETTFLPLLGNPDEVLFDKDFVEALYTGGLMQQAKLMMKAQEGYQEENLRRIAKYGMEYDPDVVVATIVTITECLAICHRLTIPMLIASTIPYYTTSEFPMITISVKPLKFGWMNKATYTVGGKALWLALGSKFNKYRASLELPEQSSFWFDCFPIIHMYSPLVGAVPSDWPKEVADNTVGWLTPAIDKGERQARGGKPDDELLLSSAYTPPRALASFLAAGDKPVYIGFGSMPLHSPSEIIAQCASALKRLGLRGLFYYKEDKQAGAREGDRGKAKELDSEDEEGAEAETEATAGETEDDQYANHLLVFSGAPHEWLLPQCCAAMHHGGAGTTAASLRAGIPTVIFPLLGDQPYWAMRCGNLGVGPPTFVELKKFDEEACVRQLKAALTDQVRGKAQALSEQLKLENGVEKTVDIIQNLSKGFPEKREVKWQHGSLNCNACDVLFNTFNRKHHCRACFKQFCSDCLQKARIVLWPSKQLICPDKRCQTHRRDKQT